MRAKRIVILLSSFLLATIVLVAQDIPSDELSWGSRPYVPEIAGASSAIRVQSDLVEVATTVRDAHGNAVPDLKKEDFLLFDNGKPQTISTFSILKGPANSAAPASAGAAPAGGPSAAAPMQPRYVGLYFDDINLIGGSIMKTTTNINFAREGAIKFIRKGLNPGERVGIFTASGILNLDFTDDVPRLLDALAKIRLLQRMPAQAMNPCPRETVYQAWVIMHVGGSKDLPELGAAIAAAAKCCPGAGSAESCARAEAEAVTNNAESFSLDTLDSIARVIRHLGDMPGRRVLVLASSGFLTLSFLQKQQKIIEAALLAGVVINSMDTNALDVRVEPFGTHFNLVKPMSDLAAGTGGKFIHNSNDMEGGFEELSAAPSVSYVLGFAPANLKMDGLEHKLKVQLASPAHLSVSARPSYYAPSPELSPSEKRFRKLGQAVAASTDPAEIPIQFAATPETLATGELSLKVLVHVDVRKLPFQVLGERHTERLIFITALFDAKNKFLTGVQGVMDLRLKEGTLKQITAQGLDAKLSISAPAGSYRVRQVVQEAVGGHISAISRDVTIQ
jgi:VWFA-related protein